MLRVSECQILSRDMIITTQLYDLVSTLCQEESKIMNERRKERKNKKKNVASFSIVFHIYPFFSHS